MVLVVIGFPLAAISMGVIENEDSENTIMRQNVWYDDFIPAVRECTQQYDIEKVIMLGPTDYTKGLARMIDGIVDTIVIEDDEKDDMEEN